MKRDGACEKAVRYRRKCFYTHTHCVIGRTGSRGGTVPTSVFCLCTLWFHYSINAIIDDCVQPRFNRVKLLKYARSAFIFLLVDRTLGYEQEKMVRIIPRRLWPMLIIIIISAVGRTVVE